MEKLYKAIAEAEAKLKKLQDEANDAEAKSTDKGKKLISAISYEEGFEWDCKASTKHIIRHLESTIRATVQTFKGDVTNLMSVSLTLMHEAKKLADDL